MAMLDDEEALIICNGYKDEEYIETALLRLEAGPHGHPRRREAVASSPLIAEIAQDAWACGPRIGMRVKLSAKRLGPLGGVGRRPLEVRPRRRARWSRRSTFLRENDLLDCFELLHFHLGSQISAIRAVKNALREAGRFYVELVQAWARRCKYLDVGGGLGVDYDGSQTNFASSMNYTTAGVRQRHRLRACRRSATPAGVPHPTIVTESGRAVVAHHPCWSSTSWASASSTSARLPEQAAGRRAAASCATCSRPTARSRARTCSRPTTTPSSTRTSA